MKRKQNPQPSPLPQEQPLPNISPKEACNGCSKGASQLEKEIIEEALRWTRNNQDLQMSKGEYSSPRISSEIPDCSMPMSFDSYKFCSLGCNYCTIAGTKISTPNGKMPIEKLEVGDEVYSWNEENQAVEIDKIYSTMEKSDDHILEVTLENGEKLYITENHPVYVQGKGWIEAGTLSEGDDVLYLKRPGTSLKMKQNNPMKNELTKQKQTFSIKNSFASGKLDDLKKKLSEAGRRNLIELNTSKEFRDKVSKRMEKKNPMFDNTTAQKSGKTRSENWKNGIAVHPATGKKRPDVTKRMTENNPMKDPNIRINTLRKAVETWVKQGFVSEGESNVKRALSASNRNFIHQAVIEGQKRKSYIMDFFLPELKLCIEYDGHSRHYTSKGIQKDQERDKFLMSEYDIKVLRIHRDVAFIGELELERFVEERIAQCV
jgi:very-short-patch-repair endonuclease